MIGKARALTGVKDKACRTRIGLKKSYACRKQFTVRVGTVFKASHVPLHMWFQAAFLMCSRRDSKVFNASMIYSDDGDVRTLAGSRTSP